jgi:general bacterial porin, GBP family
MLHYFTDVYAFYPVLNDDYDAVIISSYIEYHKMQKKIIALAIAGLASTAAFAQSNVTVYGVVDAALTKQVATAQNTVTGVTSGGLSSSRLGFKGVEDLGGGTNALFTLEYALSVDGNAGIGAPEVAAAGTSTAGTQARQQFVGLTGSAGTAVAGRLQTISYDFGVAYDPLAGSAVSANQGVLGTDVLIGATAAAARANNAIAYISPSMGGVTFAVNNAFLTEESGLAGAAQTAAQATLASATYANGPLSTSLVHARLRNDSTGQADAVTEDYALGVSYDMTVAKLFGTYQTSKNASSDAESAKRSAYSVAVAAPVSAAGAVVLSYANKNESDDAQGVAGKHDAKAYTLAYTHALSKRTTAYAAVRNLNQADAVAQGTDKATNLMAVGLRHSF